MEGMGREGNGLVGRRTVSSSPLRLAAYVRWKVDLNLDLHSIDLRLFSCLIDWVGNALKGSHGMYSTDSSLFGFAGLAMCVSKAKRGLI